MPDFTTPIFALVEPTVGADNGTWGGVLNGDIGNLDTYLGVLRQAAKVLTIGATTTLDFNAPASVFKLTVTQSTTIAIANTPANITAQQLATQFTLILVNGSASGFVVTWPASFVWSGGVAPTLQAAGTDVIIGWSPDNGTTWYTAALTSRQSGVVTKVGQAGPVSTTSSADTSLATVSLPAAKLATNGDNLRVSLSGRFTGSNGVGATVKFKFGAASFSQAFTVAIGESVYFELSVWVVRLTATTQRVNYLLTITSTGGGIGGTTSTRFAITGTAAETLASPVTLDFRGNVTVNETLSYDAILVEAATQ